jgi:UDP-GlcNAc:undecaprenyl-phosphate/decaprenyl-phosphate GlcNAc-1-phosphate transferase
MLSFSRRMKETLALIALLAFAILFYKGAIRWFSNLGTISKKIDAGSRWNKSSRPAVGGLGFFIAFLGTVLFSFFFIHPLLPIFSIYFPIGGAIAFAIGFWDDLKRISPMKKMTGQIVAALFLVGSHYHLGLIEGLTDQILSVIFVLAVMNSFNMLDNMDGSAAMSALFILPIGFMIGSPIPFSIPMGIFIIAFLLFNLYPSKAFMGDSGSMLLGYILASMAMVPLPYPMGLPVSLDHLIIILTLFAIPLVDTLVVIINRLRHGISPARGGRDHTTHNLVYLGIHQKWVPWIFALLGILQVALAFLFIRNYSHYHWHIKESLFDYSIPFQLKGILYAAAPNVIYLISLFLSMYFISLRNLRRGKYQYQK